MFMVNLSSEDPIYNEAGPSHDSNTPFEVQDHDTFVDHMDEYHEVHEMQNDVQHNYVVDSNAEYTSDSNIIPYNQYLEDNEENGVQSNVSSVQNDALMSIINEMHEEGVQQGVQSRLANKPDKVVNDSLTSELARYKELVGEYEKRAKFELTDRERKIDEQMRIIISDRNRKETSLKSELHSVQILLSSTVGHYKSKTEEVTILKKDFKQKEDKFLEEFLDIKRLKEKVEDRLYKQDQSVQTVHMLCKPKSFYDEKNKVAIGYKNPLYLTRAKQAQSALYNGHVLVTTNHTPTVVHDSEDTREIAEITRKRMLFFGPKEINEIKKAETSGLRPLSALIVYPPNTPVKLVPRVLPTKSQVKNNLYTLTQLFTEFDKTCKKRITPTGVKEGERGFETNKKNVIHHWKLYHFSKLVKNTLKELKGTFTEAKEMEEIYLIKNNNDQNDVGQANSFPNIKNENKKDVHDKMMKHISKLEREYLNLQLKCQHLQESFENKKSQTSLEAPDFNLFFKIKNLEHQIQEKDNVIRDLKVLVSNVNDRSCEPYNDKDIEDLKAQLEGNLKVATRSSVKTKVLAPGMYAIDVEPIPPRLKNNRSAHLVYINHLKESVETVCKIVEEARIVKPLDSALTSACQYTKRSQELEAIGKPKGNCLKQFKQDQAESNLAFVRILMVHDLLKGSLGTICTRYRIDDMMKSSPICLLSNSKSKSWLWHSCGHISSKVCSENSSTKWRDHNACNIFSKEMSSKFQMSMMGQMSFFLGLQVSQSPRGIFINQAKYALETLKKYGMDLSDPVDTPMVDRLKLDEDLMGIPVDQNSI
ncbi:integrase, catalytic region, zinc finger, CCHC-type containing protein [Tanacetum coccineum]